MLNVIVRHQRDTWKAVDVDIDAPSGLSNKEYEDLAREYLRKTHYETYVYVTEYPNER